MAVARPAGAAVERFESLYEANPDPWGYETSEYEREKYAATLDAVGTGPFARALEVGCSIGVFTGLLAPRCGEMMAMDFSTRALELAEPRVGSLSNVKLLRGSFPEHAPEGPWQLVVCSEILYYLDRPTLAIATQWLKETLSQGARVVVVSWRGKGRAEPLRGDWVNDALAVDLERWHDLDARRPGYRLDRFVGDEH